jgi:hypothetical protein
MRDWCEGSVPIPLPSAGIVVTGHVDDEKKSSCS